MAFFRAFSSFDILAVDLNWFARNNTSSNIVKDANVEVPQAGATYQDYIVIDGATAQQEFRLELFGTGITTESQGVVTGGAVNAVFVSNLATETINWFAADFALNADATIAIIQSADTDDDLALLAAIMAGSDTVVLSSANDRFASFGGDDIVAGGGGDDIIDGGAGYDIAIYSSSLAETTVSYDGQAFILDTTKDGEDILLNFEAVNLNGVLYVLSDFLNEPPAFASANKSVTAYRNQELEFTVTAVDPNGDPLSYTNTNPDVGTLVAGTGGTYTFSPPADFIGTTSFVVTADDGSGETAMQAVTISVLPRAPVEPGFRLYASDDFTGEIGGSGTIFGTNGFQDITISDTTGNIGFDPSFNRGGDVLHVPGDASEYTIQRFGSSAVLANATLVLTIPVGTVATTIDFEDGARDLFYDTTANSMRIGDLEFAGQAEAVVTAADGGTLPTGGDPEAPARLFLEQDAQVFVGGTVQVVGTNAGDETVRFRFGDVTLDPSFNRGGDTITFGGTIDDFGAYLRGSAVVIVADDGSVTIPVGTSASFLQFTDVLAELRYDSDIGAVLIGDQEITATASTDIDLLLPPLDSGLLITEPYDQNNSTFG
ncbi:MAG: cadherin-like domain-containing protein [Novosphingobium sp.]|nr:cadherin-like domain-containing protein [Novosphingobium sp.]